MHTVVLFGLSVSEFLESQSIFLGTFHHFKGHFKFWTPGFFWTFGDSTPSFTSGLMKPSRLKFQEARGQTRAPSGQTPLQTGVWVTRKPRKHFIA